MKRILAEDVRKKWLKNPAVRKTYDALKARLESGRSRLSTHTLERLTKATGLTLVIRFEPNPRA